MFAMVGNLQTGLCPTLMFDRNALNGSVANVLNINATTLRNANIDHYNVTRDVNPDMSDTKPDKWTNATIMDTPFEDGSIAAGNVNFYDARVNLILVQRQRVYKDRESDWVTIFEYDPVNGTITNPENPLNFSMRDRYAAHGETYRYRLLPILQQGETQFQSEGGVSDPITVIFDGVFICDKYKSFQLYADVSLDTMTLNQDMGVHTTLGNKYPIVVANSRTSYRNGGITGLILPEDYGKIVPKIKEIYNISCVNDCETIGAIDRDLGMVVSEKVKLSREEMVERRQELEEFFESKSPKIIKDWNGNIWLAIFTDNPTISFNSNWGSGLATVSAGWTEIGDVNNETDLRYAGMIGNNKEEVKKNESNTRTI